MPTTVLLALEGLKCMGCANKVKNTLLTLSNVTDVTATPQYAKVTGDAPVDELIQQINALGYQAMTANKPDLILSLSGLACGSCVAKTQTALEAVSGVVSAEVDKTSARIFGSASADALIAAVTAAGYQAQVVESAAQTETNTETAQTSAPVTVLALSGLACESCEQATRTALLAVSGVTDARVSKTRAEIDGTADSAALIAAVEAAGYHAQLADAAAESTVKKPDPEGVETVRAPVTQEVAEAMQACPVAEPSAATQSTIPAPTEAQVEPESAAAPTAASVNHAADDDAIQLMLTGLSCASCVTKVQNALQAVPGVQQARVNLAERTALVMGHPQPQALVQAVSDAGYQAEVVVDEALRREKQQKAAAANLKRLTWQSIVALGTGVPLMIWGMIGDNMMITADNQTLWTWLGSLTLLVMILTGRHFYVSAWHALKNGSATMDTLVALGTGVAWLYSMVVTLWPQWFPPEARHLYFEASTMIIGLINVGHALEQKARSRSSAALERLLDLTPPTARVVHADGSEQVMPLAEVQTGMVLRLTTGDRVPVDGEVSSGEAWLDEAMLTGEPIPQQKQHGDTVHAGTLVQDGSLLFTAKAVGSQTTLSRIIHLVRNAQSSKPEIGRIADRISAVFVPVVVAIAIVSGLIWYFVGPQPQIAYALSVATTVLIIACPCALGLATPMSIISGVGRAAEFGVLIRDADALQQASKVNTLVFDKTGTLTEGRPQVTAVTCLADADEQQVLQLAGALEQGSSHPLALAVLQKAQGLTLPAVTEFRTLRGLGVEARADGQRLLLGNMALMMQNGIDTSAVQVPLEQAASRGVTPVLLAREQQLIALLEIRDPLRADSISALQRLHHDGFRLVMLTGDNPITANAIAKEAGIDQVIAGVLPNGKAAAITELQQQGHVVAMIGDGINDAPALAQADVGIAMGGGSDVAIETAAMTLMRHSLHGVADAMALSRAVMRNMKQNLFGAFVYNSLGIPIAAGILYPFLGVLLNPIVAGGAMALSSITVVSNANRLLRFTPENSPAEADHKSNVGDQ